MSNYGFGNYICELREKKGLSQSQLGERLGVTNKAVSRWENGGAYPSTELMLPLAKELGVTIEDLYKVISEDKAPKTKLRTMLELLVRKSKIITIVCLALATIPYILFLCFSTMEGKISLALAAPIAVIIVYVALYFTFLLLGKNPFSSAKMIDIYAAFFFGCMSIGYLSIIRYLILDFPNGYYLSSSIVPVAFIAILHALKRRYRLK